MRLLFSGLFANRRGVGVGVGVQLLLSLGLLCGAAGFSQRAHAQAAETGASAEERARRERVLASFKGGNITVGELEDAIANKEPWVRATLQSPEGRAGLLQELIDYRLLVLEAERRGYGEHLMVRDGTLREAIRWMKIGEIAAITPESLGAEEVAAYYAERREQLTRKPMRRASYVTLPSLEEAERMRERAQGMKLDEFRKLAARLDPRKRGGELPYVDADGKPGSNANAEALDPVLVKAAHGLEAVGEVSAPIAHGDAFVVMRLTARTAGHGQQLAQVEGAVREQLAEARAAEHIEAFVSELRGKHPASLHPELLEAIEPDPLPGGGLPVGFPAAPTDPAAPAVLIEPDGV
ncbi:MAG: peptidylprolyl isomerase [Myxococcales bacterium]|nr:peptidylprolyl isomerase [Myxococcales bacterium]